MRRSWPFRLFALFFAPWFSMVAMDVSAVHACPMHDGAMATHAMDMAHSADETASHSHSAPEPNDHSQHHCTCLGCCCAARAALLARVPAITLDVVVVRAPEPQARSLSVVLAQVEHARPFATAPPRTSV